MAIYYWVNQGRLGNLLFQYAGILESILETDRVLSFHNEVFNLLDVDPRFTKIMGSGKRPRQISYVVNFLAGWLVKHRIVSTLAAKECLLMDKYWVESAEIQCRPGIIRKLLVAKGFFQYGRFKNLPIKIKSANLALARSRLKRTGSARVTVGVHVRLTDYGTWSVFGAVGTVLSPQWYRDRMDELREKLEAPEFIVFSDDLTAAKRLNLGDNVVYFEGNSAVDDFTALALCDHIIISPSSFAWWSAIAYCRVDKEIIAPEYWAGFKSKIWYPVAIKTEGMQYFQVS